MLGASLSLIDVCNMKDMKKIYYHVVMKGDMYEVEESEHSDCSKVPFSVNSYVEREVAVKVAIEEWRQTDSYKRKMLLL